MGIHDIDQNAIKKAAVLLAGVAHQTPMLTSTTLNQMCGARLFFKCENFQKAGAFKFRGAMNALSTLNTEEKKRGVATHSSGNHAQALSLAAKLNNTKAYIVMPSNASKVKVDAVHAYGGQVTFCTPNLKSREETLQKVVAQTGALEIHPYNDLRIIAGQATVAKEMLEAVPNLDYIIAPVGGGGLLSGTALAAHFFADKVKVVGAEPEQANDAYLSFKQKQWVPSVNPQTIADGLRTSLGNLTYPIIIEHVHDIVCVKEQTIIKAMRMLWERMKIIVEPSSAVVLSCLLEKKIKFQKSNPQIGLVISGGNVELNKIFLKYY